MEKKKTKQGKINKNMTFHEILEKYPESGEFFLEKGMHCVGCPMSQMETLEQGCMAHGLDPDKIIEEFNKKTKVAKKK